MIQQLFIFRLAFPFLKVKQIFLLREVCRECTYEDYAYLREIVLTRQYLNTFRTKIPLFLRKFLKNHADGLTIYLEGNKTINYGNKLVKCGLINRIHQLDVKDSDLTSVEFLRGAIQLRNLKIPSGIQDLSPLSGLEIVHLDLSNKSSGKYIVYVPGEEKHKLDLSPISKIKTLRTLNLTFTRYFQINYQQLRDIVLDDLNVSDCLISDVSLFLNIKKLNLHNACVSDISALKLSTSLTELDISGTLVSDISPLEGCVALRKLTLGYYKEFIVGAIKLTQLSYLYFDKSSLYKDEKDKMTTVEEQIYILECLSKIKAQTELVDLYSKKVYIHPMFVYDSVKKSLVPNPYYN
jgi:Leucine-rich repeat (LRR) protein